MRNRRVQIASISSLDTLNTSERSAVMGQGRVAHLVLPDIPTLGTYYADLRVIVTLEHETIRDEQRVASMSETGAERLRAQIVAFFTRLTP